MSMKKCLVIFLVVILVASVFGTVIGTGVSVEDGSLSEGRVAEEDAVEIEDWHDLDGVRDDLDGDYVLMNDLDEDTDGYGDYNTEPEDYEAEEDAGYGETWDEGDTINIPFDEDDYDSVLSVEDEEGNPISHTVDHPTITIDEDTGERFVYVTYENAVVGWEPIGADVEGSFTGTFDGNGHSIKGLYIDRADEDSVGLFGISDEGGEIKNLGVINGNVSGYNRVGMLVGLNRFGGTVVSNSYVAGEVNGEERTGGLVGVNFGIVVNSYATGDVSGNESVGGLIGSDDGTVENSFYHEDMPECDEEGFGSLPLSDEEFGSISTFESAGWDIEMVDNDRDKPYLSWEEGESDPTWYIKETEQTYDLTINIDGEGNTDPTKGTNTIYEHGKIVIESLPNEGWYLYEWTGDVEGRGEKIAVTISSEKQVTANFKTLPRDIYDWYDLNNIRDNLSAEYVIRNDLDEETDGYVEMVAERDKLPEGTDFEEEYVGQVWDSEEFETVYRPIEENSVTIHIEDYGKVAEEDYEIEYEKGFIKFHEPPENLSGVSSSDGMYVNYTLAEDFHRGWDPIGDSISEFTGTIDGNGYEIREFYTNRPQSYRFGLFGYTSGEAEIKNVSLVEVDMNGASRLGSLVGQNYGSIENSHVTGDVERGSSLVGGLVGWNEGNIKNSSAATNMSGGISTGGGLVGHNEGVIESSHATGDVIGDHKVGGLVGYNRRGMVSNSYATGSVNGEDSRYVGGLVAENRGPIRNSHAKGDVFGDIYVGGLIGQHNFDIVENSFATGEVNGNDNVGGLVGQNHKGTISNSYSMGNVHSDGFGNIGGLVGVNTDDGTVEKSYSTGEVSGDRRVGGLVGWNLETVVDSLWDTQTTGQDESDGGTGKTTAEMKDVATYTDTATEGLEEPWDFVGDPYDDDSDENIWNIDEEEEINDGYPFFSWEWRELRINIEGYGTVEVNGEEVYDGWMGIYEKGSDVNLTAVPDEDWEFSGWTGDIPEEEEEEQEITIEMDEDKEITAHFEEKDIRDRIRDEIREIPGFTSTLLLLAVVTAVAIYKKMKR